MLEIWLKSVRSTLLSMVCTHLLQVYSCVSIWFCYRVNNYTRGQIYEVIPAEWPSLETNSQWPFAKNDCWVGGIISFRKILWKICFHSWIVTFNGKSFQYQVLQYWQVLCGFQACSACVRNTRDIVWLHLKSQGIIGNMHWSIGDVCWWRQLVGVNFNSLYECLFRLGVLFGIWIHVLKELLCQKCWCIYYSYQGTCHFLIKDIQMY